MIIYDQADIGGAGQVKTVTGIVPGTRWNTLQSTPWEILAASKNHYHLPLALSFEFQTTVSNVPLNQFIYLTTEFNYLNGTGFFAYISNAFGMSINPTNGSSGIYRMLFETDTFYQEGFFAKINPVLTSSTIILTASADDPTAIMPDVPFIYLYYTWNP
jgi:5-hydroxyisourate hydrolase-like protein (transthyretin family)